MSNWTDKTNQEINEAVAKVKWLGCVIMTGPGESVTVLVDGYIERQTFDPCNNWADGGPICAKNKIDLEFAVDDLGGIGQASIYVKGKTDLISEFNDNEKALRAAMCVYLEMNGVKA